MKYETTKSKLVEFFGAEVALREISPGDADDFRLSVVGEGVSENTVRKHIAVAKVFFASATRKRFIRSNPFDGLKSATQPNPSRFYFISAVDARKVIASCPDTQWRLLFALSRYGGLRCPSEHLALRWGDIDWSQDRITVMSPKTEHHAGSRISRHSTVSRITVAPGSCL